MKKNIILLSLGMLCFITTYSQTQSKNKEHCRYALSQNTEMQKMVSVFMVTPLLLHEQSVLIDFLYQTNQNIFQITFNEEGLLHIYHVTDVTVGDLKKLLNPAIH